MASLDAREERRPRNQEPAPAAAHAAAQLAALHERIQPASRGAQNVGGLLRAEVRPVHRSKCSRLWLMRRHRCPSAPQACGPKEVEATSRSVAALSLATAHTLTSAHTLDRVRPSIARRRRVARTRSRATGERRDTCRTRCCVDAGIMRFGRRRPTYVTIEMRRNWARAGYSSGNLRKCPRNPIKCRIFVASNHAGSLQSGVSRPGNRLPIWESVSCRSTTCRHAQSLQAARRPAVRARSSCA